MEFSAIIEKVVEVVKGIDWEQVIATVKTIIEKATPIVEKVIAFIAENVG